MIELLKITLSSIFALALAYSLAAAQDVRGTAGQGGDGPAAAVRIMLQ